MPKISSEDEIPSEAISNYLKTIYKLEEEGVKPTTSQLSRRLGVSDPSVSNMLKRLASQGYVKREPYSEVHLTERGEAVALKILRRHRLLELFLTEIMELPLDKVDQEAEKLEHVISDDLEERIDIMLKRPKLDPHGDPIPSRDGEYEGLILTPLSDLKPGQMVIIAKVDDRNSEKLHYLMELGLIPSAKVYIKERAPFGGPIIIQVGSKEHALGKEVSDLVYVTGVEEK